jgi:hypothetical protein
MKRYFPHIGQALILTPAIYLVAIWILVLSSSGILAITGFVKLALWALLMSFGAALSIAMFAGEALRKRGKDE